MPPCRLPAAVASGQSPCLPTARLPPTTRGRVAQQDAQLPRDLSQERHQPVPTLRSRSHTAPQPLPAGTWTHKQPEEEPLLVARGEQRQRSYLSHQDPPARPSASAR